MFKFKFFNRKKTKLITTTQQEKKDPIEPDIVFFGLIFVNFGPLNKLPNTNPPISEAIQPSKIIINNILTFPRENKKKNKLKKEINIIKKELKR